MNSERVVARLLEDDFDPKAYAMDQKVEWIVVTDRLGKTSGVRHYLRVDYGAWWSNSIASASTFRTREKAERAFKMHLPPQNWPDVIVISRIR